ncbi:hypothetical protein RJ639_021805 [Escallonia herrerae]|uniref:4-alpha-glucanotransferase n=1 Tax=Escallonia herrerae TaxID=1293975 RepID=A0AA88V4X9_9ASTE|nr:hypothetical protein RJ639_021805 [Escallonia herrerae]
MALHGSHSHLPSTLSHHKLTTTTTTTTTGLFSKISLVPRPERLRTLATQFQSTASPPPLATAVGEDLPVDYADWFPTTDANCRRRAGVLLHPTSFPGPYGIGDLELVKDGLLMKEELPRPLHADRVNYSTVADMKDPLLRKAAERLILSEGELKGQLEDFRKDPDIASWLEDAAYFAAIDNSFNVLSWYEWPEPLKNRHLAALEEIYQNEKDFNSKGFPLLVSGVPPDAFSETGQLWDSSKFNFVLPFPHALYDIIVYKAYLVGPGESLFDAIFSAVGNINIIAEDLGVITEDVVQLRKSIGAPGMAVLQFGFGSDARNPHLPHNHERNQVVYTGTHDNDTIRGWWQVLQQEEKSNVLRYLSISKEDDISWALIGAALASVARTSIIPMQDILGLGSSARMNIPATQFGNWGWRIPNSMGFDSLNTEAKKLRNLLTMFGRL